MKSERVSQNSRSLLPMHKCKLSALCLILFVTYLPSSRAELIDFTNRQSLESRQPIIIAHRGGVVTDQSAECSATALSLAAKQGYDMVELDVRMSSDHVPIVFHDRTLEKACGKGGAVQDYSARELEEFRYLKGEDAIMRLSNALKLCRQEKLGVMLDLKSGRDSKVFLNEINRLIELHGLDHASISFSGSETARNTLTHVRFTPTDQELHSLSKGDEVKLQNRFWFGLPKQLNPDLISTLKAAGALILPAINTFRYPANNHRELARQDIIRLLNAGVDGFQIDSIYFDLLPNSER